MYVDFKFDLLFLAFVIGIFISLIAKLEHPLTISVVIVVIYILLVFINNEFSKPKARLLSSEEDASISLIDKESKQTKEVKENYSQSSDYKKSNGLFDGLLPTQLINRFNYLYEATKHPQHAKSYVNYMFNNNNTVPNSVKHLEEAKRYYPQLSRDQVNMTDCMIYDSNHPSSCNQGDDKWMAENTIMTKGINNKKDLSQVIREDFKPPNLLLEASSQSLFK